MEGQSIRSIKVGCDDLDFAFAALVDDGVHLVLEAATRKHRAIVADPQGTRIVHPASINLDVEAFGQAQLGRGKLISSSGNGGRCNRREIHRGALLCWSTLRPRRRSGRRLLGYQRPGCRHENSTQGAGEQQMPPDRERTGHDASSLMTMSVLVGSAGGELPRALRSGPMVLRDCVGFHALNAIGFPSTYRCMATCAGRKSYPLAVTFISSIIALSCAR